MITNRVLSIGLVFVSFTSNLVCCSINANDILLNYDPGIARGVGWQKIGAYVNLGSYYLVGTPAAVVLAFALHIGGKVNKCFPVFQKIANI